MTDEIKAGLVEKFFAKPSVAVIKLEVEINLGDSIHFKGNTTDFTQTVDSMQLDHVIFTKAPAGSSIGIKVKDRVRAGDDVFKIIS